MLTSLLITAATVSFLALRPLPSTSERSAPQAKEEHVREPLLLAKPLQGEALTSYYEPAAVSLKVTHEQEKELTLWAAKPAKPLPAALTSVLSVNAKAFSFLEQGTSAPLDCSRRPSALLGQRIFALGRSELARGRLAIESADRTSAAERAFVVVRLSQDLIATGPDHLVLAAMHVENEALAALEAWLERPPWHPEEVKAVRALLVRARASTPEVLAASERTTKALKNVNDRLSALERRIDEAAKAYLGQDARASAAGLVALADEVAGAVGPNSRDIAHERWRDFEERWLAVEDPIRALSSNSYKKIEDLMQDVSSSFPREGSWNPETTKAAVADLRSACLAVAELPREREKTP